MVALTPRRAPGEIVTNELFLTLFALIFLSLLLWKGSSAVRGLAAFLLIYGIVRILEVAIIGNGFNDFARDMFQRISDAFGNLAKPDLLAFATLAVTLIVMITLVIVLLSKSKQLRAVAAFTIIFIVVRIFDAVALGNGFSEFAVNMMAGLSDVFGRSAANLP